jgi:NRAMP (natural resistance-associated macrophage protein)-like metal ion transporter
MPDDAKSLPKTGLQSFRWLGPGLITGASDDDPSGIATYSQAGAQAGYALCWTMLLTLPLMSAVQEICARIGSVTGYGLAGNLRRHYPAWLLRLCVGLLVFANVINIGADLGAMGAALQLIVGGPQLAYAALFGVACAGLQIFVSYRRYVSVLRWLTVSLLAYVGVVFAIDVPWGEALRHTLWPDLRLYREQWLLVVALFGTTISPYLFFWQCSSEATETRERLGLKSLHHHPETEARERKRIRIDTYVGMAASNLVGFFIIVTAAATLHINGITEIETSAQAAEALRPIAGQLAFALFALGIIGTGMLAVPVLAGSAAFAVGEALRWPTGLERRPREAKAFYATIAVATAAGIAATAVNIDPMRMLIISAVINGVIAAPLLGVLMMMASRRSIMGEMTVSRWLLLLGWAAMAVMGLSILAMVGTSIF